MADLYSQLKQYEQSQATKFPTSGTVHGIDGSFVDVLVSGSSTILRHVKCVGTPSSNGQVVLLTWENGTPTAHITGGSVASSEVALIRGPQGIQGPKGDKGDKGDTGAQGPAGSSDPASAIHAATAAAAADADEWGFSSNANNALRKITWANIKSTLKTYFDTLYAAVGHNHNSAYAALTHASQHQWKGTDELNIRDLMMNSYPAVFKSWQDTAGFTASHTGTGSFTAGLLNGVLATGATSGSRACLYSISAAPLIGYGPLLANFRMRINPSTLLSNSTLWFGMLSNPTAPGPNDHHAAFKIVNGLIYASCGNGSAGNLTATGVTTGQYSVTDLYIKEKVGCIEYYVDGALRVTFNTNLPNSGLTPLITLYSVNSAATNISMAILPLWFMQGS